MAYIFGSIWDRRNRNALNELSKSIEYQGKSIQDLVAKGQLTPTQYASLIQNVNGLIAKGEITVDDLDKNNFKIDLTMVTDEFLQQIAGTAGINAVPADGSLTTRKYVDKSVTPEKTDFFSISSNKFNVHAALDGKTLDADGSIIDSPIYWLSDYIEFPSDRKMSVTDGSYRINLYDKDKKFIIRGGITSSSLIDYSTATNVAFMRISGSVDKNVVTINDGTTLRPYAPYEKILKKEHVPEVDFDDINNVSVHPNQEVHFRNSKNLYNRFNLQKDKSMDAYGGIVTEEGRYLSVPIMLDGNKSISFRYEDGFRLGFYGGNGEIIYRRNKIVNESLTINLSDLNGAHYMLVSPTFHFKDDIMINYGENSLPYEDYGFKLVSTPEVPISIDNSIIPAGSGSGGGGGGSTTPSIVGSTQIFESISGNYAANVLTEVYSTTETSELDYIELSTNNRLAEIIITYIDDDGVEKNYKIIDASNSNELPQTIENIITHGGVNIEFINYDEGTNNYKIAIKNFKFSNGFKVEIRNTHSTAINIAVQMAGRYYV